MSNGGGDVGLSRETLLETLNNILSSDERMKQEAEKNIQELELQLTDEFGIHLVECVVDTNNAPTARELAAVTLKQYVKTHWCSSSGTYQPPEIGSESKKKIKVLLLSGLSNPNIKIRDSIADSVSVIAQSDWPDNWPTLLDTLVEYLTEGRNAEAMLGSMRVLSAFTNQLDEIQLPNVLPNILQEMYRILDHRDQYSERICGEAISIFTDIVTNVAKYQRSDLIQQYLEPSIAMFCAKFLLGLQDGAGSNISIKFRIVEAIGGLTLTLPKCISNFLPKMLPLIWEISKDCAKVYRDTTVNLHEEEIPDKFDDLVFALLNLISALMMGGADKCTMRLPEYDLLDYHWFYLQDSLPPEVLHHLLIFIEITDEQIDLWTNDPCRFITEEKITDNTERPSIRRKAQDLLLKIVHRPERAAANALCDVLLKQIDEGNTMRSNNESRVSRNWWKLHEASIQVFGIMKDIIIQKQRLEALSFDFAPFLKNVVLQDLENSEFHPLLLGSCLYIGGLYAEQMPLELRSKFLEATINSLRNQPACARICAAKAATFWLRAASAEGNNSENEKIVRVQLPALFQELFNLGNQLMSVEVLKIVLENFATLTSFDKAFTASVESSICTLVIAAFLQYRSDSSICKICQKIFGELTINAECVEPLHTCLVPMLVAKLTVNSMKKPKDGRHDLDALQILVQHAPQPLNSFLLKSAFPAACRFILSSDNYLILLSGANVIRTYLSVAAQLVIDYRDNDGKTGPQYISRVAAHLLNSKFTELLIDNICEIMTTLIMAGNTLGENLNRLLNAILTEMLRRIEMRPCVRKLLMVYARLINTEFDAVLEFLSTAKGPANQSALAFVISDGFCKEHESFERDDRRIVTLALFKILEHGMTHQDSSLHQIYFHETESEVSEDGAEEAPELVVVVDMVERVEVAEEDPEFVVVEDTVERVEVAEQNAGEGGNRGIPLLVKISKLITSEL